MSGGRLIFVVNMGTVHHVREGMAEFMVAGAWCWV